MARLPRALMALLLAALGDPAVAATVQLAPSRAVVSGIKEKPAAPAPKTDFSRMDKPGPVDSPDPYFTLRLGEAVIQRDAVDHSLAYYRPRFRLGKRAGTPLAEGVGELAGELDGFRFRYYKFESGGSPKWADMQVVVVAERPEEATLENVQQRWPEVTRLKPVPFALDAAGGMRLTIPYPPRAVTFSRVEASGGEEDRRWYLLSTETHPSPGDLLSDKDNSSLNEAKARDFAALITSDLADMPSFQPVLEVRATYGGWRGVSPLVRGIMEGRVRVMLRPAAEASPAERGRGAAIRPGGVALGRQLAGRLIEPAPRASSAVRLEPAPAVGIEKRVVARPELVQVIGSLKPRADIDYTYSGSQEIIARVPITYPKATTPNYDYYFLSDSGRFGGPYFEPSSQPDRPQRAEGPAGFSGYWYESHFLGRRLVWAAPRGLRLAWEVESGLRPSCRFSLTSAGDGRLTAHISYDLYPDLSMRQLSAATEAMARRTGEKVEVLPFTDLLDANRIALSSGNPTVQALVAQGRLSVTKLAPRDVCDAWFRVNVEMPVDDWATLTLFMKLGELGVWDCGVLTGAGSGMGEKVTFELNGDLLETMGGPVVPALRGYDAQAGSCEVAVDNYGLQPLDIRGLRFVVGGDRPGRADVWLEGEAVHLPGVGTASSFDQSEGASGSVQAVISVPASAELAALTADGSRKDLGVTFTSDMVGPSTRPEDVGGGDPDILFSFLRSLCYQYVGSSEIIRVPVAPAERSQWFDYRSGSVVVRYQGFVYTAELDLAGANWVAVRRLPREGAYASTGRPGEGDVLEYRATFVKNDGTVVRLPAEPGWLAADVSGINLDMTQAR